MKQCEDADAWQVSGFQHFAVMPWPVEYLIATPDGMLWAYGRGQWVRVEDDSAAAHWVALGAPTEGVA